MLRIFEDVGNFPKYWDGGVWAWTQVRMESVISLTQSILILVVSITSICLKFVAGMVAMDGIGFGGKARIRTGEDLI